MDSIPEYPQTPDLAQTRDLLRSLAEQGRISPSTLEEKIAALDSGDPAALALVWSVIPPGYRPEDPLVLSAGMSKEDRSGVWTIPPYLSVQAAGGSVRLNCLQARAAAPIIQVQLSTQMGSVLMVLPEGWAVDVDRLTNDLSSVRVSVPNQPAAGCPLFIIRGTLSMGDFNARPASRWDRRRAAH